MALLPAGRCVRRRGHGLPPLPVVGQPRQLPRPDRRVAHGRPALAGPALGARRRAGRRSGLAGGVTRARARSRGSLDSSAGAKDSAGPLGAGPDVANGHGRSVTTDLTANVTTNLTANLTSERNPRKSRRAMSPT